jgi:hypothetical protein
MRAGFFFFVFPEPSTLRFLLGSLLSLFKGLQNLPPKIHRDLTNKSFAIVPLCLTRLPQNGFTLKNVSLPSLSSSGISASRMLASPAGMSRMKARSKRYWISAMPSSSVLVVTRYGVSLLIADNASSQQ